MQKYNTFWFGSVVSLWLGWTISLLGLPTWLYVIGILTVPIIAAVYEIRKIEKPVPLKVITASVNGEKTLVVYLLDHVLSGEDFVRGIYKEGWYRVHGQGAYYIEGQVVRK